MTTEEALALVAGQRLGVLVTLRRDGRPQTSNVVYAVADRQVRVPVTEDRAKTRNQGRGPAGDASRQYPGRVRVGGGVVINNAVVPGFPRTRPPSATMCSSASTPTSAGASARARAALIGPDAPAGVCCAPRPGARAPGVGRT